ncbi:MULTISPECIES: DUF3301 domain-containing protein [unclassified Vibrio]|uniref:DUF3301 domain-containing protein n=1 Tax=Vibrio sp. HB236076 TaxID=3232307 RepID=A0AB39HGY5_9VIBR|nr:DUF3301 domain-containing protein [Vibrio sp. HB161653]MDP5254867.1 DUF3301 domain-containing protein [Vibrio sp. HB161653]
MQTLIALVLIMALACLFWQHRQQAERAHVLISHKCKQLDLQLISVSLHRLQWPCATTEWRWIYQFQFEFSSLGDDCYQAILHMHGPRAQRWDIPPYRIVDSQ